MNSNFTKVETLASPISELSTSDLFTVKAVVGTSTTSSTALNVAPNTFTTVVGYAPTQFASLAQNASVSLLTRPGRTQATSTDDPDLLVIPPSARIVKLQLTNNGTTIAGGDLTLTVGTTAIALGVQQTPTVNLAVTTPFAAVNTALGGAMLGGLVVSGASIAFGGVGQAYTVSDAAYVSAGATLNLVSVRAIAAAVTAGDLAVFITYQN
jgi:hypothetical protein